MTEAPASPSVARAGTRRSAPGRAPPSLAAAWSAEHTRPIEIVAPDWYCTALLLKYAASVFPAEIVSGPDWIVRMKPPNEGAWVLDLLVLIERWLESAPLPCATVLYGDRTYLIRASAEVAEFAAAALHDGKGSS